MRAVLPIRPPLLPPLASLPALPPLHPSLGATTASKAGLLLFAPLRRTWGEINAQGALQVRGVGSLCLQLKDGLRVSLKCALLVPSILATLVLLLQLFYTHTIRHQSHLRQGSLPCPQQQGCCHRLVHPFGIAYCFGAREDRRSAKTGAHNGKIGGFKSQVLQAAKREEIVELARVKPSANRWNPQKYSTRNFALPASLPKDHCPISAGPREWECTTGGQSYGCAAGGAAIFKLYTCDCVLATPALGASALALPAIELTTWHRRLVHLLPRAITLLS